MKKRSAAVLSVLLIISSLLCSSCIYDTSQISFESESSSEISSESENLSESEIESISELTSEDESLSETVFEQITENESENISENKAEKESEKISETEKASETEKSSESEKITETETSAETERETDTIDAGIHPKKAFNISDVPEFSGKPYVAVCDNIPNFDASEISKDSYKSFCELDTLGRCRSAVSCIGTDIMPTEERGGIGQIKPSGWHTVKYDIVEGKYLYNRCHLIGYQISGENANTKNLITGTRYMNIEGMLPFERIVADYIKETENHVMYRSTPIFEGNDLLAKGVHIEAYSVEDEGDGICFNVFCYNCQPGIEIDYSNGESKLAEEKVTETETSVPEDTETETIPDRSSENNEDCDYVLNTNTKKFHFPDCSSVKVMGDKNKQFYKGSRDDLLAEGYSPCGKCHP